LRNSGATTQAEPDFIALSTTPGLEALGQKFAVTDTSSLDPTIKIPPTIGVATGIGVARNADGELYFTQIFVGF
jgi:gamma-glutamyltranspeptidase/glutathione hydrolase